MKKMKRVKIIREVLEAKIAKNARRIQSLSEQSFEYRKLLEAANRIEKQKPYVKTDAEKEAELVQIGIDQAVGVDKTIVAEIKEGMVDVVSETASPDPLAPATGA